MSIFPEGQASDDVPVGVASRQGLHIALRACVPDVDLMISPSKRQVPAAGLLSGLVTLMNPDQVGLYTELVWCWVPVAKGTPDTKIRIRSAQIEHT